MEPFLTPNLLTPKLAPEKPAPRKGWATPLGAYVADIVKPALAARGLSEASLVSHWVEIVGAQIAAFARPEELQWPPRGDKRDPDKRSAPATLVLRIDGAFALEASHLASQIVARVNGHLGWRCVHKIAYRQGPLEPLKPKRVKPKPPSAEAQAEGEKLAEGIEDEDLRKALARFGARVIDSSAGKR
jgi:hypothetical protein